LVTQLETEVVALEVNRMPPTETPDSDVRGALVAAMAEVPVMFEKQACKITAPQRKGKVKLETYAGQGASLESFLAKERR